MVTSACLVQAHVHDVGLVHFHFGRDHRHVRDGHDGAGRRVLHARHHGLAGANRQIGHDAVDGRSDVILGQDVLVAIQVGLQLRDLLLRGSQLLPCLRLLRLGLRKPGLSFAHRRHRRIVLGLLLIEILLREQLFLVQFRGPVVIRFGAVQFGSVFLQRRLRGGDAVFLRFQARFGCRRVRQRRRDARVLRHHVRIGLHRLHLRHHLALPDAVAFLHHNFGDGRRAERVRPEIDVVLRLDLAGSGNGSHQVLPHHAAGLNVHNAALVVLDAGEDTTGHQHNQADGQQNLRVCLHLG